MQESGFHENDIEVTILEDVIERKKIKSNKILPEWIISSIKIDSSIKNSKKISKFFPICDELRSSLKSMKIKKLFPVQHSVIPAVIESWRSARTIRPSDICVSAPTGSGKTLAYIVPILQLLHDSSTDSDHRLGPSGGGPRVLIVVPVRDLATQVHREVDKLSTKLSVSIRCALCAGQINLARERRDLAAADVVVCTPGRLVEHIRHNSADSDSPEDGNIDWSAVRILVIDEADRVLKDNKHDWFLSLLKHIDPSGASCLPRKDINSCFTHSNSFFIQKILLSATLTHQPHLLEQFLLHYPKLFTIGSQSPSENTDSQLPSTVIENPKENFTAPEGLKEFFVMYNKEYCRILFIVDQIRRLKMSQILCFTNKKETAVRLNQLLNEFNGVRSAHLHCEQPPDVRKKLRKNLETGSLDILITVDSMARGMDIAGVKCVIQYDLRVDVSQYIHRVGRTARAGQTGLAYALVPPNQIFHMKQSLAECGRSIKRHKFSMGKCFKYMNEYNTALEKLQNSSNNV